MDRRTVLRAAVLGGAAAGLAGCGIASHGGIVVDGPGPEALGGTAGSPRTRPKRADATNAKDLVQHFLRQAVGDDDADEARTRCMNFLDNAAQKDWDRSDDITVLWFDVDLFEARTPRKAGDAEIVEVDVFPVGTLKNGRIEPPSSTAPGTVFFTVTARSRNDLFISDIHGGPNTLLLSSLALAEYYKYRNLYFWAGSNDEFVLVPDPRYVYTDSGTQARRMIEWLLAGPSPWLAPVVNGFPANCEVKDNPTEDASHQHLVVNLSQEAAGRDAQRLIAQLTWTLSAEVQAFPGDESPIQLKIESAVKASGGGYKPYNPAVRRPPQPTQWFALADGKVRRLRVNDSVDAKPVPFLEDPSINRDVVEAAFLADREAPERAAAAAFVRAEGGHHNLWVGANDQSAVLRKIEGFSKQRMLRPLFVDSDNQLVVADGQLYHVQRSLRRATKMSIPGFASTKILAFALSPEARRVALVTRAGLSLAPLARVKRAGKITIEGPPRWIPTPLSELSGVAFTAEAWLAIAGTYNGDVRIAQISLDGAQVSKPGERPWLVSDKGLPKITSLTAYPDNPDPQLPADSSRVVFTSNATAYEAVYPFLTELAQELVGPAPEGELVNPFFMD